MQDVCQADLAEPSSHLYANAAGEETYSRKNL